MAFFVRNVLRRYGGEGYRIYGKYAEGLEYEWGRAAGRSPLNSRGKRMASNRRHASGFQDMRPSKDGVVLSGLLLSHTLVHII